MVPGSSPSEPGSQGGRNLATPTSRAEKALTLTGHAQLTTDLLFYGLGWKSRKWHHPLSGWAFSYLLTELRTPPPPNRHATGQSNLRSLMAAVFPDDSRLCPIDKEATLSHRPSEV